MDKVEYRTFKGYILSFLIVLTEIIHDATYRKRLRTEPALAKNTLPYAQQERSKNIRSSFEINGSDVLVDGRGAHLCSSPVQK
jgi:hypothetical protein